MKVHKSIAVTTSSLFLVLMFSGWAIADVPTNNALEAVMNLYRDTASNWGPVLTGYATRIFWILAAIDVVWMAIWLALNPGEFSELVANLVRKVMFIGFFWMLLQPVGGAARGITWASAIVQSMVIAGGNANIAAGGASNVTPASIFDTGFQLCAIILQEVSVWSPGQSLALVLGGMVIMVCFALIAAMMLLVYVQSYFVIYAGVIFLGFGGSVFTKDIALKYFQAALAMGAKLFVMCLVVGLGQVIINEWTQTFTVHLTQIVLFIGAAVVLLALVKAIPDMVGDMINGFSWGAGESLSRTSMQMGKMAVGAAVGATVGAVGGTMAVKEAARLSSATNSGGLVNKTASTVSNLGKAAAQDTAARLSGEHRGAGTKGGRMAAILQEQRLRKGKGKEVPEEPYPSSAPDLTKTGSIFKDTE